MGQSRSPGYPSMALGEAIETTRKLHDVNRTNPIDREAAAKDLGYSGLTGTSAKALSDLSHFGLIERAGKGGVRVSQRAVDILYPESAAGKAEAMRDAALSPNLFNALQAHFHDGSPSENSLRGYLVRQGFASAAIPYIVKGYTDTWRMVQQEGAYESHRSPVSNEPSEPADEPLPEPTMQPASPTTAPTPAAAATSIPRGTVPALNKINMNVQGTQVHLEALLDRKGLAALKRKLASLEVLLDDDDEEGRPDEEDLDPDA